MTMLARLMVGVMLLIAVSARAAEREHEFVYKPDGNPQRVAVAGDFNNWSSDANPMTKGADGAWHATLKLNEGVYHYKFVVDGSQWKNDPNAEKSLDVGDNYGGVNSGVVIGPDARKLPPPQPNSINVAGILHDPRSVDDCNIVDEHTLRIRVRAQAGDLKTAYLITSEPGLTKTHALYRVGSDMGFDSFENIVQVTAKNFRYWISLKDGDAVVDVGTNSRARQNPNDTSDAMAVMVDMTPTFVTPAWARGAIWYQIFPERFRNGDSSNDPNDHDHEHVVPWTGNWWKTQPGEAPGDENFYKGQGNVWKRRYGGDVQGLIQALPYLRKLGVNAIYLNPMFEADSMHKYDTSDYRHIDDNFGFKGDIAQLHGETDEPSTWQWTRTDKLFLDFVGKAHAMGFKVILDGVFNHVGRSHWAFQDVLKNGKSSKYADWFDVRDWNPPIKYIAWDRGSDPSSDGALPVFKKNAATGLADGPRQHVLAITKRWLSPDGDPTKGVDGWRLDVPGDIPHPFWIEWRKLVKSTKPDAYISGEIWTWAQPWLAGDQFDAVMNYRWADAAQQFFVNQQQAIPPSKFDQLLDQIAFTYPYQVSLAQMNLFDSHDTDRFSSMFVNPDLPYDGKNRIQDNGPQYKPDKPSLVMWTRMEQAVAAQMAFVGAPMIYYGDEAGMWSPDDPSNRQPMLWPEMKFQDPAVKFNPELFAFYQRTIAIRRKLPELQQGFFHGIVVDDAKGVYAFARDLGDRHAYVVLNRSGQDRKIEVPASEAGAAKLVNWLDPAQARVVESSQDRPTTEMKPDAAAIPVLDGKFTVTLKPFTSAVLTKP